MGRENTIVRRNGEKGDIPDRSSRYFEQQGYWYFRTREGMDIGPFDTQENAEDGVNGFIGFLKQAREDVVTRITKYVKLQPRKDEKDEKDTNNHSTVSADVMSSRTDRLFAQGDYWYFRTREGMDIGPFDNRGEASIGAKGFVEFLEDSQPEVVHRVTSYIRAAH